MCKIQFCPVTSPKTFNEPSIKQVDLYLNWKNMIKSSSVFWKVFKKKEWHWNWVVYECWWFCCINSEGKFNDLLRLFISFIQHKWNTKSIWFCSNWINHPFQKPQILNRQWLKQWTTSNKINKEIGSNIERNISKSSIPVLR